MKKLLLFPLALLVFSTCKKEEKPDCIGDRIEVFKTKPGAQFIRKIEVEGNQTHYWFRVYASPVDAEKISWILDSNCDTVCHTCTGWCVDPPCFAAYNSDDWQTIWED
jgi:hypothetical protein